LNNQLFLSCPPPIFPLLTTGLAKPLSMAS
jgi:hypothetical protein